MNLVDHYKQTRQILFDSAGILPKSNIITIDGPVKNIHFLELGEGEPLILIHGAGAHSSHWINILKPLSENFHLYVLDCPGSGLSDRYDYKIPDIKEYAFDFIKSFMDTVNIPKASFLGNSMGGFYSINFALYAPDRVDKLILIGAPAGITHWIPYLPRFLGAKGINHLLMNTIKPGVLLMRLIFRHYLVANASQISRDLLKHEVAHLKLKGTIPSLLHLCERIITLKGLKDELYFGNKLSGLKMPVYFLWGEKDVFEKPEVGTEQAKYISFHNFDIIENAGHIPWLDKPDNCVALIIKCLSGPPSFQ